MANTRRNRVSWASKEYLLASLANVLDKEPGVYMVLQQEINMGIFRAFAENGIEFACPTKKVHLSKAVGTDAAG